MFCKNCGSQIADDAIFCSHCGTRLVEETPAAAPVEQVTEPAGIDVQQVAAQAGAPIQDAATQTEPEIPAKPFLEGMEWNVSEYPDSNAVERTEDINFEWNLDPNEIRGDVAEELRAAAPAPVEPEPVVPVVPEPPVSPARERVNEVFDRVVPEEEAKASIPVKEAMEAANKIESVGQFNTFNKKNAQFQELLDREYEKVRGSGTIGNEQERAEEVASQKFDSRKEAMTMDEFLQQEGAVKLYEPKELESDVLDRIAVQDRQRQQKEAEEAARIKALEQAREEAIARKLAEEERMNQQLEERAAAEAEIRAAEEEAARKAAEDAARLEAIARRQAEEEARAQEEARQRAAEEARAKAEEEARIRQEEIARAKAEEEARAQAEEAARLKAEAELKAAQEAARIRAQQEAANAAREEAEFKAAQERRQREEEIARLKKEAEEKQRARAEDSAAVEDEVRKALEQTAKMRQEEEDKIKAALAGIRGGRFSDTLSSTIPVDEPEETPVIESVPEPAVEAAPVEAAPAEIKEPEPQTADRGTILANREEIEAAHRHTRYNIEGMAKAREDFFADLPGGDPQAEREAEVAKTAEDLISPDTRTVDTEAIVAGLSSTKKLSREDLGMAEAAASQAPEAVDKVVPEAPAAKAVEEAAPETPAQVGAGDLLSQFASVVGTGVAHDAVKEAEEDIAAQAAPKIEEEITPEIPQEPKVEDIMPQAPEAVAPEMPQAPEFKEPEVEELSFETPDEGLLDLEDVSQGQYDDPSLQALMADKPGLEDTMMMPEITRIDELTSKEIDNYKDVDSEELRRLQAAAAIQEARAQEEAAAAAAELKAAEEELAQPTHETAQQIAKDMAAKVSEAPDEASVGVAEGSETDAAQEMAAGIAALEAGLAGEQAKASVAEATDKAQDESGLSPRELKKKQKAEAKEAKRLAKEKKKEEKQKAIEDTFGDEEASGIVEHKEDEADGKKGGKGRLILMIILILLCVVFALELVGIGIKMFASTSAAAEFIDNILNSLIHMITGETDGGAGSV